MANQISIQVKFTEQTQYGSYTDAIYYPLDVYNSMSAEQIQADKQARIDGFIYTIEHPVVEA